MCLICTDLLRQGRRLTAAHDGVVEAMGVDARVLPMCDELVRTFIRSGGSWRAFPGVHGRRRSPRTRRRRGAARPRAGPPLRGGARRPRRTEAVVIGPSNPVISIGPILALPGMREAVAGSPAPVVAISPFVGGRAVETDQAFCAQADIELSTRGVSRRPTTACWTAWWPTRRPSAVPTLVTDTLMEHEGARRRVAQKTTWSLRSLRS